MRPQPNRNRIYGHLGYNSTQRRNERLNGRNERLHNLQLSAFPTASIKEDLESERQLVWTMLPKYAPEMPVEPDPNAE
jgi:hypothetical protein